MGRLSATHVASAFDEGPVLINQIIYAELSIGFDRIEDLDDAFPDRIDREHLPWEAAFLASRCFVQYRRRGGTRRSPLPDFYIAAHAAITSQRTPDPRPAAIHGAADFASAHRPERPELTVQPAPLPSSD